MATDGQRQDDERRPEPDRDDRTAARHRGGPTGPTGPTSETQEHRERERRGVQSQRGLAGWRVAGWGFAVLAVLAVIWWLFRG
ncbi:MAG: hypothetical protein R6X25_02485 [Candidatus Krumholzibacteriia bacterium]